MKEMNWLAWPDLGSLFIFLQRITVVTHYLIELIHNEVCHIQLVTFQSQ